MSDTTLPELKLCPFCGSAPMTRYDASQSSPLIIRCPKCREVQVQIPIVGFKSRAGGGYKPPDFDDLMRCMRAAVKMWNKRFAE